MTRKCKCRTCLGTGVVLLLNSMFIADGFRRTKCWMCDGTGHSSEPDAFSGGQKRFRALDAEFRASRLQAV